MSDDHETLIREVDRVGVYRALLAEPRVLRAKGRVHFLAHRRTHDGDGPKVQIGCVYSAELLPACDGVVARMSS